MVTFSGYISTCTTVNVEIFMQYIFSCISHMVSDARKYDASENLNHYRSNGNKYKISEQYIFSRISCRALDA